MNASTTTVHCQRNGHVLMLCSTYEAGEVMSRQAYQLSSVGQADAAPCDASPSTEMPLGSPVEFASPASGVTPAGRAPTVPGELG